MKVLQHTRNDRNPFFKPDRPDRLYGYSLLTRTSRSLAGFINLGWNYQFWFPCLNFSVSIFKNSVSRISHIGLVAVHVQISNTSALLEGPYVFNNMDNKLLRTFGAKFQGSFTIFLCEITMLPWQLCLQCQNGLL